MMDFVLGLGLQTRDLVLKIAGLLTNEVTPGLVVLALLIPLGIAILWLIAVTRSRRGALLWLQHTIERLGGTAQFNADIDNLSARITAWGAKGGNARSVSFAWSEYVETLIRHEQDGGTVIRNSVRPNAFFNLEDLHFGPGFWRILPGLFVTIGLFLTFLGLISALTVMSEEMKGGTQVSVDAMGVLLRVASAKFIMSLTGLLCSIVFTVALRARMGGVEGAVNALNRTIERHLSFISLEDLAVEQLRAIREQKDHFRHIGMELVAELGRPLREELPRAISNTISEAMKPLVTQMTQMGTEGVGGLVKDLSSQFSQDVGHALTEASAQLRQAGEKIAELVARMDQSSGRMGSEMQGVVERLAKAVEDMQAATTSNVNATRSAFSDSTEELLAALQRSLESIQSNTRDGAKAINDSAEEMRKAAEAVREHMMAAANDGANAAQARLTNAGSQVHDALNGAAADVIDALKKITGDAADAFLSPIGEISARMGAVAEALGTAGVDIRRLSDSVREGASATSDAAGHLRGSAQTLGAAIDPVRATTSSIEHSIRSLTDSMAHVAVATRNNAESAAKTLATAEEVLAGKQEAVQAAVLGIGTALEKLRLQGEQMDDLDQKLGDAFARYQEQVESAVQSLFTHVREMQEGLTPALGTMREIVEQAEQFMPQSAR
jgi:methyl-accepting chemotaxis protein